ncbi:hypothetical protein ACHAW6_001196 [Cyclotella cf. meneghiniana]
MPSSNLLSVMLYPATSANSMLNDMSCLVRNSLLTPPQLCLHRGLEAIVMDIHIAHLI